MNITHKYSIDNIQRDFDFDFISVLNNADADSDLNIDFSESPYNSLSISCSYIDEKEFNTKFANHNELTLCTINLQSISAKFGNFSQMINFMQHSNSSPDVICIQELWQFPDNALFKLNGYHPLVYKLRRNSVQGGGVGIYIKSKFTFNILDDLSIFMDRIFESLTVEITVNSKMKIKVCSMYRPGTRHPTLSPIDQFNQFMELFNDLCSKIALTGSVYLLGDINLDLLKYKKCEQVTNYVDSLFSHGLLQIVTKPTRCTPSSATLIDHIITNACSPDLKSTILISDLSDHFFIFHSIKTISPKQHPKTIETRNFSKLNLSSFNNALLNLSWSSVTSSTDTQTSYNNFHDTFLSLYELFFPLKKFKFNKNTHKLESWMTTGILTSRLEKIRLCKFTHKHPSPNNLVIFKTYRNLFNKIVKAAKKMHFDNLFKKFQSNLIETWRLINEVINKKPKKNQTSFSHLLHNNLKVTDSFEIANIFNEHFTSIAHTIANDIEPTDRPPDFESLVDDNVLFSLTDSPVTISEVYEAIGSLQKKKTQDIYGISVFFISKFALILSKPLQLIFQLSFKQHTVPQQFKMAKVIPIFKNGSKDSVDNYRPISLLSTFSKIQEKIVCKRLNVFLENNKLLSDHQFGFRMQHSTIHPLTLFINKISETLNKKEHALAIFCDLRKAFDTIDHGILLQKLHAMGIRGTNLLWFQDYLSNRKQFVQIDGVNSFIMNIKIGVPQGSILGPILFLIYINDLPSVTSLFSSLFADDTKLVATHSDLVSLYDYANAEFQKVVYYFRANRLSLHPSKTKFILFSNSREAASIDLKIFINNNNINDISKPLIPIERIHSNSQIPAIKFLGVFY